MPTMRPQIVKYLLLAYAMLSSVVMHAQLAVQDPGSTPPPVPEDGPDPNDLSIDQAILFLLLIGVLFGIYITVRQVVSNRKNA